jgi:oxygen-dependent protoporphyrinogen oxidase
MSTPRIVIVGGGMAGLAAAWECHRRGLACTVFEADDAAGGVVRSVREGDLVLDGGPDAFLATKQGATTLCRELGLERELIEMLPPRGAFIHAAGRFHPLPEGGAFGVPVQARAFLTSRLLSWRGKLRVACEPLVSRTTWRDGHDESAATFFRRRFGAELTSRVAQPLLGGIHAGRLDDLSARAVVPQLVAMEAGGHSVWLALRRGSGRPLPGGAFRSLATGMGRLPEALVDALPRGTVRTGTPVAQLAVRDGGGLSVQPAHGEAVDADIVLLAAPAWRLSPLLGPMLPPAASLCAAVPYVSSATVLLAYPETAFPAPLRGSGYLMADRDTGDPVMAVTWVTGKWPHRAAPGTTLIRAFFGGAGHEAVLAQDDGALGALAHAHMARWWRAGAEPRLSRVFRWHRSSPQHVVGHLDRVRELQGLLDGLPGVGVAGSGFRAVGIPDVVADARAEMSRLIERWQQR